MLPVLACFNSPVAFAQEGLGKEDKLKAAYLLNFTKYMEWPLRHDNSVVADIRLCVASSFDFADFLRALVNGRKVGKHGHEIKVLALEEGVACDLTYLQSIPSFSIEGLELGVVVIDSTDINFDKTAITFFTHKRKLRFEIDLEIIKSTGVSVSSELLKLARIK